MPDNGIAEKANKYCTACKCRHEYGCYSCGCTCKGLKNNTKCKCCKVKDPPRKR